MFEAKNVERLAPFKDRRMWRLVLARLHPDAGGDHDLFAFACAVRDEVSIDEVSTEVRTAYGAGSDDNVQGVNDPAVPFLKSWQDEMGHWSSSNRDALKNYWAG